MNETERKAININISDVVLEFVTEVKGVLEQNLSKVILYSSYARVYCMCFPTF